MSKSKKNMNITVEQIAGSQRLDKYLALKLDPELSRADVKKLIEQGCITINGCKVKPNTKVKPDDEINLSFEKKQDDSSLVPTRMKLDIVYEDDFLIVVNKPAGLVVHPAAGHRDDTLANALAFYTKNLSDVNGPERLGIVHRLDRDTSGIIVIAKDNKTHRNLSNQFKKHTLSKTYLAIVQGSINFDEGLIDMPLARNPFDRKKMSINGVNPREAVSKYKVLKRTDRLSLVEVYPQTGRTHQIRVHMAHLGHPILGDNVYNRGRGIKGLISRQALHAINIRLKHPNSGKIVEFNAKIPKDMQDVIKKCDLK